MIGPHPPEGLIVFSPSISDTIVTMWIVMAIVLVGAILMTRGGKLVPGRAQNMFEAVYEGLSDFGIGLAGPTARPYIPIFAAFFLLILFCNWVGLVPFVGRVDFLRAPSSDVNITIGLALVAFLIFHIEGFRHLGAGGYLGKFFPVYEFKHGIGAGFIAMFVGLIELMLEFVKPVTLSMRLFGNIYGGEVALGVITALTVAIIPVATHRAGTDAQRDPGPHLQRPDPHVHRARDRESPRGGGPGRRGSARRHRWPGAFRAPARTLTRQHGATNHGPMNPSGPLGE